MGAARPIMGLAAIIILAGGLVMQFFVILSGNPTTGSPTNLVYFLQTTTDNINANRANLPNPVRWTYLALCGAPNGVNGNCYHTTAALPFDPPQNFQINAGTISDAFAGNKFYYLSRFAWVFYLIALFFGVVGFFLAGFALCARLGSYLTGFTVFVALFFQTLAASLMTAWVVEGRKIFNRNGETARIGAYAMGYTWGTMVCFLIATILFCVGGRVGKDERAAKTSYFGRKRSTRSRGSFRDSESGRRVKDEYE